VVPYACGSGRPSHQTLAMLRKISSTEFLTALAKLVIDFGFMETCIRSVIVTLARDGKLAFALIPPSNTVSQNLDLLHRLCGLKVQGEAITHWSEAIAELRQLFDERNRIFHGHFFEENEQIFLARSIKGKRGGEDTYKDIEIDDHDLILLGKKLNDRRRQLMDFVTDYREDEKGKNPPVPPSQYSFPSLSFGY
jgi:hypothetical protein